MVKDGKLVTCDRCGEAIFLTKLDDKVLDGGYTRIQQHTDIPQSWGMVERKNVCSKCNSLYQSIMAQYWDNGLDDVETPAEDPVVIFKRNCREALGK